MNKNKIYKQAFYRHIEGFLFENLETERIFSYYGKSFVSSYNITKDDVETLLNYGICIQKTGKPFNSVLTYSLDLLSVSRIVLFEKTKL